MQSMEMDLHRLLLFLYSSSIIYISTQRASSYMYKQNMAEMNGSVNMLE